MAIRMGSVPKVFRLLIVFVTAVVAQATSNSSQHLQTNQSSSASPSPSPSPSPSSFQKITNENIHHAVKEYMKNRDDIVAQFGPISQWDVSHVTDMSHLFSWQRSHSLMHFNEDISHWNTERVVNLSHAFFGNTAMSLIDLHRWNTSRVVDMTAVFANTKLYQGHGLGAWNTGSVTSMRSMFHQALAFNSNAIHNSWYTRSLVDASRMFHGAQSFESNHQWKWYTPRLKDMSEMFAHAVAFRGDLSNLDVISVTSMKGSFFKAEQFNADLSKWKTDNVQDMNSMFAYATNFEGIGLDHWNVQKVTNTANMLKRTKFNQNLNQWHTKQIMDLRSMFRYASTMKQKVCWTLNKHATVDGIFFQTNAHFDHSCVDKSFVQASCCPHHLDPTCGCDQTTVNEDHEVVEIIGNNSSISQHPKHPSEQQEPGAVGAAQLAPSFTDKNQYFLALGIGSIGISVFLLGVAFRRMRQRGKGSLTTTTIDCDLGSDPDISGLDMNPTQEDESSTMSLPPAIASARKSRRDNSEDDGDLHDVNVRDII